MKHEILIPGIKATFAVGFWGASFIATKLALQDVSPVTIVWMRFAMGVIILGIFVLYRRQFVLPKRDELAYFALLGFIGITFHQWLQSTGLITAQASTTAWIVATTPVFMAILGWLFLKELLGRLHVLGILLASIGVLLVVSQGDWLALISGRFGVYGDLLILISAPNWAIFSVLSRYGLARHPAARMMFYVMVFGWLFTTGLLINGPGFTEIGKLSQTGWLGILFLGIACSGLAYIFWYDALQAIPVSQVGAFLYLEPLIAVVVAGVLLGEPILVTSIFGGGFILFGVWLVNRPVRKEDAPYKQEIS
ncbi:MAG: DMT family transporter [Anaerolineales bacterium]|nr:DMT family transporter [Anaerolineales bacterium]